jgi:hypothetical protein
MGESVGPVEYVRLVLCLHCFRLFLGLAFLPYLLDLSGSGVSRGGCWQTHRCWRVLRTQVVEDA